MRAGRRYRFAWLLVVLSIPLGLAGCRGPGVGPDLSGRDRYLATLREELWHGEVIQPAGSRLREEPPAIQTIAYREPTTPRSARRLHLELEGNYDPSSGRGLQLRLEPRDTSERPFQVIANLRIGILQTDPFSGTEQLLGTWDFSSEQLAACWDVQWSSAGYTIILPPQKLLPGAPAKLIARMTLADRSRLDASLSLPSQSKRLEPVPTFQQRPDAALRPAAAWDSPPLREAFKLLPPMPLRTPE